MGGTCRGTSEFTYQDEIAESQELEGFGKNFKGCFRRYVEYF